MQLTAVIIDDEELGRNALKGLLADYCSDIEIVGTAGSAQTGKDLIEKMKPDLVLLDVEMPYGSGFDLLRSLPERDFDVIFTTAYDQYAINALRVSAIDYLLKPIDHEELISAVNKVREKKLKGSSGPDLSVLLDNLQQNSTPHRKISLPTNDGFIFVEVSSIICCESTGNYTWFYVMNQPKMLISRTLREYEEILEASGFCRIHQSHLVNLAYVTRYIKGRGGQVEMADGQVIEVSRRKKDEFLARMGGL